MGGHRILSAVKTTIGDLGEFGMISRVLARFPQTDEVIVGPGDDAAVVRAPDGRVVASTDLLVEGRHFRREWSSAHDIGGKAAAQNFADIAAMGARPTALLVGLAAPPELEAAWIEELADGLRAECSRAGAAVVGGDTVRAAEDAVTLAITALGDLEDRSPVCRSGARAGDVVALAGPLGLAAAGLELLRGHVAASGVCVEAHRRPQPPYEAGVQAARIGATAMLDVSDGLLGDLNHIAAASGVAIDVRAAMLPAAPELDTALAQLRAAGLSGDAMSLRLAGGEDHGLVAAFPPDTDLPEEWTVIGRVIQGTGVTVDGQTAMTGAPPGWDHFAAPS